jgi:hypothetical protein
LALEGLALEGLVFEDSAFAANAGDSNEESAKPAVAKPMVTTRTINIRGIDGIRFSSRSVTAQTFWPRKLSAIPKTAGLLSNANVNLPRPQLCSASTYGVRLLVHALCAAMR